MRHCRRLVRLPVPLIQSADPDLPPWIGQACIFGSCFGSSEEQVNGAPGGIREQPSAAKASRRVASLATPDPQVRRPIQR